MKNGYIGMMIFHIPMIQRWLHHFPIINMSPLTSNIIVFPPQR